MGLDCYGVSVGYRYFNFRWIDYLFGFSVLVRNFKCVKMN